MMEKPAFPEQERDAFHLPDTQLNVAEMRAEIDDAMRDLERARKGFAEMAADLDAYKSELGDAEAALERVYKELAEGADVHAKELRVTYEDVRKLRESVKDGLAHYEEGKRMMEEVERAAKRHREFLEGRIKALLDADAKLGLMGESARKFPRNQA